MPLIPLPEHPVQALRRALLAHGYQPVPVYSGTKKPFGFGWQSRRGMPPFNGEALSTGIVCHNVHAIDIDIDDQEAANRAVLETEDMLGTTPLHRFRVGSARRLLLYAGVGTKRILKTSAGKIEFLGVGQQFVAYGIHPDGSRFEWVSEEPASFSLA